MQWGDAAAALAHLEDQIGLWRWEFDSGRVFWSDPLLALLGRSPAEFGGTFDDFEALLHPNDRSLMHECVRAHLDDGTPFRLHCRLLHNNGHHVPMLTQGAVVRDGEGRALELVGTVLELSDDALNEELKKSERTLRDLAENVPGAIFRYCRRGDGRDEIEYMSSGCRTIWEHTAEDLVGDPAKLWEAVLDEDLPAMQASVARSAETLSPWVHRWRIRTPSGALKHLEGRGTPQRLDDGSVLWNSLILDVSAEEGVRNELAQHQEMLAQAQKMEAIGRISGGIAHDFNNLLGIILGNAELFEFGAPPAVNEVYRGEIVTACERGADLTRRLLSFARQSRLVPREVNVNEVVGRMSPLLARTVPENVQIETVLTAGLWASRADPAFLESSLLNLVINARDAMTAGGRLTIETSNIRATNDYLEERGEDIAPGRYVMLAVTDTGLGIPAELLPRVTEPFFTTKGPEMGSGLGLAAVQGFAKQSGGMLHIYSEPGTGTTVKLYLPALEEPVRARTAPATAMPEQALAGRVLVVEDEPAVLAVVARTLRAVGLEVTEAADAAQALHVFEAGAAPFDLLLSDVVMPGAMQGPALAAALVARNPGLRVVFMSGYPNEAAIHGNGLRASDAFLMKPVQRRQLLETVRRVLAERRAGDGQDPPP